jgi:protein-disulfide isomerase
MNKFIFTLSIVSLVGIGFLTINFDNLVISSLEKDPEKLVKILQKHQQQQKFNSEKDKIVQQIKNGLITVGTNLAPKNGKDIADYKFIVFTDLQCSYCKDLEDILAKLKDKYKEKIQIAYKHLPLAFHPEALPAARAAWAAQQQEKFFEYLDEIWKNQKTLNQDTYLKIAQKLNLNIQKFKLDSNSEASLDAVKADMNEAKKLGFTGTPVVVINGVPIFGAYPLDYFERVIAIIDDVLKHQ